MIVGWLHSHSQPLNFPSLLFYRTKTSWGLYSCLKMSSRQWRRGGRCNRWKHREGRKEQRRRKKDEHAREKDGGQSIGNMDLVALCWTVATKQIHGDKPSPVLENGLKPLIWPFTSSPSSSFVAVVTVALDIVYPWHCVNTDSLTFGWTLFRNV